MAETALVRTQYATYAKQLYKLLLQASAASFHSKQATGTWALARIRSEFRNHRHETDPRRIEHLLQRAHLVLLALAPEDGVDDPQE